MPRRCSRPIKRRGCPYTKRRTNRISALKKIHATKILYDVCQEFSSSNSRLSSKHYFDDRTQAPSFPDWWHVKKSNVNFCILPLGSNHTISSPLAYRRFSTGPTIQKSKWNGFMTSQKATLPFWIHRITPPSQDLTHSPTYPSIINDVLCCLLVHVSLFLTFCCRIDRGSCSQIGVAPSFSVSIKGLFCHFLYVQDLLRSSLLRNFVFASILFGLLARFENLIVYWF